MSFDFFKIDTWWKAVLLLGLASCAGAGLFDFEFLEEKHLFGLGIGMLLLGIGYWKSWKTISEFGYGGMLSYKGHKFDIISFLLIVIGILLIALFGYKIILGLL